MYECHTQNDWLIDLDTTIFKLHESCRQEKKNEKDYKREEGIINRPKLLKHLKEKSI